MHSGQMTINTIPQRVDGKSVNPILLHLANNSTDKTIFIGNHDVSISNGYLLGKGERIDITLLPNEELYIVSEVSGALVSWLSQEI